MAPPPKWTATLKVAQNEAALAVRLYNDAAEARGFEGFVVHMHLAWLYLVHARFMRDGVDFRYQDRNNPRRFVKVDGEYKRWELARCVQERWPDPADPVRNNLDFFIRLRNRVEHRHKKRDTELALAVSGHAQALLLNFEEEMVATFGEKYSLARTLRFPVFIGTFTEDGEKTLRRLRDKLPADLKRFIAEFHSGLTDDTQTDPRFELRLRVVLERVVRDPEALSMQFTRWDDMTDAEKELVEKMGRRGQTVIREQKRSVVGHGLLRVGQVVPRVAAEIPFTFNNYHFLRAWQIKGIRPLKGKDDPHPERTNETYCVYDELSQSYGYTEAWVKWLIKNCKTAASFEKTTGRTAVPKSDSTAP